MKNSNGLLLSLVLLGGMGVFLTRTMLENYSLKVELATLKAKGAQAATAAPAAAPSAASPAAATAGTGRSIEVVKQMMSDALAEETGSEKKAWIRVDPRDREAGAFAKQIAGVFSEAGWTVQLLDSEGLRFKPGLLFLVGSEEEPPSYVKTAQRAVEATGEDVSVGTGYLSYYESKKKETPDWQGTKFLPGQTFVLLVGRKPEPAAQ